VQLGENSKETTSTTYVLIKTACNYSCLFALAEVDPLFTDKTIKTNTYLAGGLRRCTVHVQK
jgi:hypothetical protein